MVTHKRVVGAYDIFSSEFNSLLEHKMTQYYRPAFMNCAFRSAQLPLILTTCVERPSI